ncbi:hypothetical protein BSKO_11177 [Bryopsis sp. KO-2023]|nr:hypothetical protein BSKO_11177 [Bryopsis sp. KO-2023]
MASGAPAVPEGLLKNRKRSEEEQLVKAAAALEERKRQGKSKLSGDNFKRAEAFVTEYRAKDVDLHRLKKEAQLLRNGGFKIPSEKVMFAIRVAGIPPKLHPITRDILKELRLWRMHSGVFLKVNSANISLLHLVAPYVAYGYPNVKSIKDLIYKRGCCNINQGLTPLTSNEIVEEALGEHDIICLEDLVHEIQSVGPNFNTCVQFLWPFKLKSRPTTGVEGKMRTKKGNKKGNLEEKINNLIRSMT